MKRDLQTILSDIEAGRAPRFLLVFGDDLQVAESCTAIVDRLVPIDQRGFNLERFDGRAVSWDLFPPSINACMVFKNTGLPPFKYRRVTSARSIIVSCGPIIPSRCSFLREKVTNRMLPPGNQVIEMAEKKSFQRQLSDAPEIVKPNRVYPASGVSTIICDASSPMVPCRHEPAAAKRHPCGDARR